jgi:hypothetical protein
MGCVLPSRDVGQLMNNYSDRTRERANTPRSSNIVMWLFGEMIRLPMTTFVYSLEVFVRTMQGMQRMVNQGVESADEMGATPSEGAGYGGGTASDPQLSRSASAASGSAASTQQSTYEEQRKMRDQDLSGDETLKLVRFKILFIKRDHEYAFSEREVLVSYSTSAAEWGGLKVADFLRDAAGGQIPLPPELKGVVEHVGTNGWRFREKDEKYVKIYFEVLQRWDREEAEYDRQQVEVLREIRNEIGGVRRGIGGKAIS